MKQMCQKNKETGKQRPVRERMVDGERAKSLKEAEPGLTTRKGTRTSQKSQTANVMQDARLLWSCLNLIDLAEL